MPSLKIGSSDRQDDQKCEKCALDDRSTARKLARVAEKIGALDQERRQMIDRYAVDQMTGEEYISGNRALDEKLERLVREKAKLAAALRSPQHEY